MRLEGQKEKKPGYVPIPSVVFLAGAAAMVALLCPWLQVFSGLFLFYPFRLSGGDGLPVSLILELLTIFCDFP